LSVYSLNLQVILSRRRSSLVGDAIVKKKVDVRQFVSLLSTNSKKLKKKDKNTQHFE